jgi:hypothetical protein
MTDKNQILSHDSAPVLWCEGLKHGDSSQESDDLFDIEIISISCETMQRAVR